MRFKGGGMRGRVSKKVHIDGYILDSKLEARRYAELRFLEKAGEVRKLEVHPKWEIIVGRELICHYIADFRYQTHMLNSGCRVTIVEDVKDFRIGKDGKIKFSTRTAGYLLKKKLMFAVHGIEIIEYPERPKRNKKK